ncbi:hypothetical protein AU210_016718 [Fusarium oxysporum f. sp. radicis-cucumerinum]|uniref:Zn(2)-C6 fungal-type domain-containing protein n=1 Tax=Fusarium oxysporum f. sp. radicis-cucumerinum TaxID=327505 RepID=A0A2H3G3Y7_FUSOX|nr:hypothetical protein AU210_016718 [Fusarium oxysporum f. sp. radicis-cucumerinum]
MNDTNDDISLLAVVENAGCHDTMAFLHHSHSSETTRAFPERSSSSALDHSLGINANGLVLRAPGQDFPPSTNRTAGDQNKLQRQLHHSTLNYCQEKDTTKVIKQSRYKSKSDRIESSLTRTIGSCIRCTTQHIKCSPNTTNLVGPCLSCASLTIRTMPCLRYRITHSNLYRTAFYHYQFFKNHLMVGPKYGDFHIQRNWTQNDIRVLEVAQDSNVVLRLVVREFVPSFEEFGSDDTRGNKMYGIPWAIADPEEATKEVNRYLDRCIGNYLDANLDYSDHLVWGIFLWAVRLSVFPQPNKFLSDVIRLWVASRFLEGRWRCVGLNTLGAENLSHRYGKEEIVQVPPFVNYQMAAPTPAFDLVQQERNWFTITLSVFILLHNYEQQCRFHRDFARRRDFPVRFVEMPVINAIHSGAKPSWPISTTPVRVNGHSLPNTTGVRMRPTIWHILTGIKLPSSRSVGI